MNYTLEITYTNGKHYRYESSHLHHFLTEVRSINWQKLIKLVRVRVYYGTFKDVSDNKVQFINQGEYSTKKDFWFALKAFLEEKS